MNNTENLKVPSQNLPSGRVPSADASSLSISYKVDGLASPLAIPSMRFRVFLQFEFTAHIFSRASWDYNIIFSSSIRIISNPLDKLIIFIQISIFWTMWWLSICSVLLKTMTSQASFLKTRRSPVWMLMDSWNILFFAYESIRVKRVERIKKRDSFFGCVGGNHWIKHWEKLLKLFINLHLTYTYLVL